LVIFPVLVCRTKEKSGNPDKKLFSQCRSKKNYDVNCRKLFQHLQFFAFVGFTRNSLRRPASRILKQVNLLKLYKYVQLHREEQGDQIGPIFARLWAVFQIYRSSLIFVYLFRQKILIGPNFGGLFS
jgi:hypothetical protein